MTAISMMQNRASSRISATTVFPLALALSIAIVSARADAQAPSESCTSAGGVPSRLTPEECAALQSPINAPTMIYQDADVQVLVVREGSLRSDSAGEATLVLNLTSRRSQSGSADTVQSLQRRQRFDCRAGTRAIVDEQAFTQPVARGEPVTHLRTPNAQMLKPPDGSVDQAILAALCRSVPL